MKGVMKNRMIASWAPDFFAGPQILGGDVGPIHFLTPRFRVNGRKSAAGTVARQRL